MIEMIGIYRLASVPFIPTQPYTKSRTSKMLVFSLFFKQIGHNMG